MNSIFEVGQIVRFKPEWLNPNEEQEPYIIVEAFPDETDPHNNYYYVSPIKTDMFIIPIETVRGFMMELNPNYKLSESDQAEWNKIKEKAE